MSSKYLQLTCLLSLRCCPRTPLEDHRPKEELVTSRPRITLQFPAPWTFL